MIGQNFKIQKIIEQLLTMFCMLKKKKIYPAYISKQNHEKQAMLLMIPNRKGWHGIILL